MRTLGLRCLLGTATTTIARITASRGAAADARSGHTYGTSAVPRSPLTLDALDRLKSAVSVR